MPSPHNNITPEKVEIFLAEFATNANVSQSANNARLHREYIYLLLKEDENFKARFNEARERGIDALEDRAFARTHESDTMMIFMLKGNRPNRYGDKKEVNLGGNVSVSLNMVIDDAKS